MGLKQKAKAPRKRFVFRSLNSLPRIEGTKNRPAANFVKWRRAGFWEIPHGGLIIRDS
jgi:hypothetical protein